MAMNRQARKVLRTGALRSDVLKLMGRMDREEECGEWESCLYRTGPRAAKSPNRVVRCTPLGTYARLFPTGATKLTTLQKNG